MRILAGDMKEMPDGLVGAYVTCYAAASDYQTAVKKGVAAITQMGYRFENLRNGVREIPPASWDDYLNKVWPEYVDQMPSALEVLDVVNTGRVFFGPFVGFAS